MNNLTNNIINYLYKIYMFEYSNIKTPIINPDESLYYININENKDDMYSIDYNLPKYDNKLYLVQLNNIPLDDNIYTRYFIIYNKTIIYDSTIKYIKFVFNTHIDNKYEFYEPIVTVLPETILILWWYALYSKDFNKLKNFITKITFDSFVNDSFVIPTLYNTIFRKFFKRLYDSKVKNVEFISNQKYLNGGKIFQEIKKEHTARIQKYNKNKILVLPDNTLKINMKQIENDNSLDDDIYVFDLDDLNQKIGTIDFDFKNINIPGSKYKNIYNFILKDKVENDGIIIIDYLNDYIKLFEISNDNLDKVISLLLITNYFK